MKRVARLALLLGGMAIAGCGGGGNGTGGSGGAPGSGGGDGSGGAAGTGGVDGTGGGAPGTGGAVGTGGLAATGGDTGTSTDALAGSTWEYDSVTSTGSCASVLTFTRSNTYTQVIACVLPSDSAIMLGKQEEDGTYAIEGAELTTTATRASCPGTTKVGTYGFTIARQGSIDVLTLVVGPSRLQFARYTGDVPRQFIGTYGCYDSAGVFLPSPLLPL